MEEQTPPVLDDPTQSDEAFKEAFGDVITSSPQKMPAGLYLVATPIGNMRDISLRMLDIIRGADAVACEDTRMTGKLLSYLGLKKKLVPYHDHNADEMRPKLLKEIEGGQRIALVSDAGMPLISDPGFKLVRDARERGLYVTSIPGASAPLMALQLSGLPSDQFVFLGFLPNKTTARKEFLKPWNEVPATLIFFESAQRLDGSLKDAEEVLGNRAMALVRELTKKFEETWTGTISEIRARLEQDGPPKGEIVIVVDRGEPAAEISDAELDRLLVEAIKSAPLKEAAASLAQTYGRSKKDLYNRAIELKNGNE